MFQGKAIDIDLKKRLDRIYERDTLDFKLKQFLRRIGIKSILRKMNINYRKIVSITVEMQWRVYPSISVSKPY